ncbi:Brix-domain-containing protein [Gloeophyllum trabeum ATCC 11539]|uniref:Brix-domain-containing protein n=1 Tax=Gloeophyllum trabeum (strain ATCC 11539 / FP-39264 / Madison 617) TaxID=670483 RepID=S7QA27_GLOTA|nr:Brix-domain-containing protein [Gloeophyllum trabeum ATCC 11539]EPQ56372.1 Brix-domain-containing protein [Gloeophyllum trabeum ATCC 11539]
MVSGPRFEPSLIKNKVKREDVYRKKKKAKSQDKLQRRLAQAKLEASDPAAKQKRKSENVPHTLDNQREFDPSILTAQPQASSSAVQLVDAPENTSPDANAQPANEAAADIASDEFAAYFESVLDPTIPPKVLVTTGFKATKATYDFCDEISTIFPGAEFIRRKKGKGFEMGKIAMWAGARGYTNLCVVNEDQKKPNAITLVHLPNGPTAYFKLTSIENSKRIRGHAKPTTHYPELVLNGFVTRLGHAVGRMFQTLFPPMPEFQGRQVVTLHNQRDFLFFRRHRYAFRSTEKVALQEIGPRFTLKLRWLTKGIPAVQHMGEPSKELQFDKGEQETTQPAEVERQEDSTEAGGEKSIVQPPRQDEYLWIWKPELETTRRTFFL